MMKCHIVSEYAELSQESEISWDTIRTMCTRQNCLRRGRKGRQWEELWKDYDKNENKFDLVQVEHALKNLCQRKK